MNRLQRAGIPAGVCQTAEERAERDPQLKHLDWLTVLRHSEIGEWRVKDFPVRLSEAAHVPGRTDRTRLPLLRLGQPLRFQDFSRNEQPGDRHPGEATRLLNGRS
jgi:hypothetical protein